jgi:hypothetical protein
MAVPHTPIAANFNQALDVEVNLFSQFPLNPKLPVNNLTETINLTFSKFIRLSLSINTGLS